MYKHLNMRARKSQENDTQLVRVNGRIVPPKRMKVMTKASSTTCNHTNFGGPPRAHDGTSYEDLFEQAVNRIPNHSPDWTDHDEHAPGVTIMELLSSIIQDL